MLTFLQMNKQYSQFFFHINRSDKILLVTHIGPDGDGIASLLAVYVWLKKINKDVDLFVNDKLPQNLNFLPESTPTLYN